MGRGRTTLDLEAMEGKCSHSAVLSSVYWSFGCFRGCLPWIWACFGARGLFGNAICGLLNTYGIDEVANEERESRGSGRGCFL